MKKVVSLLILSFLLFLTPLANIALTPVAASTQTSSTYTGSGLDCNGWSSSGAKNFAQNLICADPLNHSDNGWYVGHDEPSLQFFSSTPGSGSNMQYSMKLPAADPQPKGDGSQTANFENYAAFWFAAPICDSTSYPQGACTAASDTNSQSSGSALLELQLYPPGWEPFVNQISCNHTQWCAALNIDSAECTLNFAICNPFCTEPINFAFLQDNGIPAGPPGPDLQTLATFTPNSHTLFMNPGDQITVTIQDTASGLKTTINDITTGGSGFMVASGANGFEDAVAGTATSGSPCSFQSFNFHPEYSTAKAGNITPWTALFAGINFAVETGHFQLGANGDGDADDAPCFAGPNGVASVTSVGGCVGKNTDFDGTSYVADWADGTAAHPSSFAFSAPKSFSGGTYSSPYPTFLFATDAPSSEASCNVGTGTGCTIPPINVNNQQSAFYPFYSINAACNFLFGNDIAGQTTNDYAKTGQYGAGNQNGFQVYYGTFTSATHDTPTCQTTHGVPEFGLPAMLMSTIALLGVALLVRRKAIISPIA